MDQRSGRSAQEVFADHLREGKEGSVEVDLVRNYAADVVVLSTCDFRPQSSPESTI